MKVDIVILLVRQTSRQQSHPSIQMVDSAVTLASRQEGGGRGDKQGCFLSFHAPPPPPNIRCHERNQCRLKWDCFAGWSCQPRGHNSYSKVWRRLSNDNGQSMGEMCHVWISRCVSISPDSRNGTVSLVYSEGSK